MSGAPESSRVRCLVSGRVQGVFYRAGTVERARTLGLSGWARNLADGRVEVLAAGPRDAVADLVEWLWEGPPAAEVTGVEIEEWTGSVAPGFEVRRG